VPLAVVDVPRAGVEPGDGAGAAVVEFPPLGGEGPGDGAGDGDGDGAALSPQPESVIARPPTAAKVAANRTMSLPQKKKVACAKIKT